VVHSIETVDGGKHRICCRAPQHGAQ
jgi:hypothetical protein